MNIQMIFGWWDGTYLDKSKRCSSKYFHKGFTLKERLETNTAKNTYSYLNLWNSNLETWKNILKSSRVKYANNSDQYGT